MKILFVGDVHATADSLDECGRLVDFALKTAKDEKVDRICYSGDLFHNHAILSLYVVDFWLEAFKKRTVPTVVLVGNHDRPGNNSDTISALDVYQDVEVVNSYYVKDKVLYVGYQSNHEDFLNICNTFSEYGTVICHQTISGSTYDNGFYAKDGISPDLIPQKHVIAGHIHRGQEFGKVWYPGAPRWRTASDTNTDRAIWVIEFDQQGVPISRKPFDTSSVCKRILSFEDRAESPADLSNIGNASVIVDVYGSVDYVDRRKKELKDLGVRVRTFPDQKVTSGIKESEGISIAFSKYVNRFTPKNGTVKSKLWEIAMDRIGWTP